MDSSTYKNCIIYSLDWKTKYADHLINFVFISSHFIARRSAQGHESNNYFPSSEKTTFRWLNWNYNNATTIWASAWDFQQCGICDQQSLRSACTDAQSDQSLCLSLEYSLIVKLLTEHHLGFPSFKGGCRGSPESTLVKMSIMWQVRGTWKV